MSTPSLPLLPPCGLLVIQYLLGAGGMVSGGGGHAAGGFDELRLMLLSIGLLLEMDSNMQHDDDSQPQHLYWLPDTDMNQSKPGQTTQLESYSVIFG